MRAVKETNEQAALQERIDRNLQRVYRETLDEGIPDRFRQLLDALAKKEPER